VNIDDVDITLVEGSLERSEPAVIIEAAVARKLLETPGELEAHVGFALRGMELSGNGVST